MKQNKKGVLIKSAEQEIGTGTQETEFESSKEQEATPVVGVPLTLITDTSNVPQNVPLVLDHVKTPRTETEEETGVEKEKRRLIDDGECDQEITGEQDLLNPENVNIPFHLDVSEETQLAGPSLREIKTNFKGMPPQKDTN